MTLRTLRVPFNMETMWFVICGSIIVSASMKEKPTHLLRTLATAGKIREYQLEDRASFVEKVSLPFNGLCRYGNKEFDYIENDKSSDPIDCQQKCKNTNGCTAYAYRIANKNCLKYRGGPYTKGDGWVGYGCYPMPDCIRYGDATCGNNGNCGDIGSGAFACTCTNGYKGDACATPPRVCTAGGAPTCQNGGSCGENSGAAVCNCVRGYTGSMCETAPTDCTWTEDATCGTNGNCGDTDGGAFACTCTNGYTGDACATPPGDCTWTGAWTGFYATCGNNGNCGDTGGGAFACTCTNGYTGDACATPPGDCTWTGDATCGTNGNCGDTGGGAFACTCTSGSSGDACAKLPGDWIQKKNSYCDHDYASSYSTLYQAQTACSSDGSCIAIVDYECDDLTFRICTTSGNRNKDGVQDHLRGACTWIIDEGVCKTINVNSGQVSSATTVTVNDISSYNCPSHVDKSNWLSTDKYSDTFKITTNGDSVTATRTDGSSDGWGMPLSFKCCKASDCFDGIQNQDEIGVDCGGSCSECENVYSITSMGVSCEAEGMADLNDEEECESAIPELISASLVQNAGYWNDITMNNRPPGCFYNPGINGYPMFFWNHDKNGQSNDYCISVCKAVAETCEDGIKNQDETDIDCGGACSACGSPADASYSITSKGVSCADKGLTELNDEAECESAVLKIQSLVPNSKYVGDVGGINGVTNQPPGCYFGSPTSRTSPKLYWNNNKNGKRCSYCISVCKGCNVGRTARAGDGSAQGSCDAGLRCYADGKCGCNVGGTAGDGDGSTQGSCVAGLRCYADGTCGCYVGGTAGDGSAQGSCDAGLRCYADGTCASEETCEDKIQNQDETDIDCGGVCPACGCANKEHDCERLEKLYNVCTNSADLMKESCAKTCGFCIEVSVKSAYMAVRGNYACVNSGASCGTEELCTEHSETSSNAIQVTVTCCDDASTGSRPGCVSGVDFKTAQTHCENLGLRLCTAGEIKAGSGEATGCGFDVKLTWTSNSCLLEE